MPAGVQVAVEARLVDRVDRPEAHRDGRELPEVRHEPRVRVGRQPRAAPAVRELLAEAVELRLRDAALEEGPRVHARRGVALEVDLVAAAGVVLAAEEVVEPDLVEARRRLVGRDVPADADLGPVGAGDRHGGVPADERADAPLDVLVAREVRLALRRDRVDVVGAAQRRQADLPLPRPLGEAQHEVAGALRAERVDDAVERGEPLGGLVGVGVDELAGQAVGDDGAVGVSVGGGHAGASRGGRRCCTVYQPWPGSKAGPGSGAPSRRTVPSMSPYGRSAAKKTSLGLSSPNGAEVDDEVVLVRQREAAPRRRSGRRRAAAPPISNSVCCSA